MISKNTTTVLLNHKTAIIALLSFVVGGLVSQMVSFRNGIGSTVVNKLNHQDTIPVLQQQPPPSTTLPTSPPIIAQIIPPDLYQELFTPDKLIFNVSRSMLRRSRPIVGNNDRLHGYIRKLHSKQCTVVLCLGGSVTAGHNAGGFGNAYGTLFKKWLDARYPCLNEDGSVGEHVVKMTMAPSSQSNFVHWNKIEQIEKIDLAFIEFNVNDAFIGSFPHALEDKGEVGKLRQYMSLWYSEVLLRRLLLIRKPDPLAIITFNSDYKGIEWATFPPWTDPKQARQMLFRNNEEPLKIWMSSIYEIPVFSASIWILPLSSKQGTAWQFNGTNPYATSRWHTDKCCHPSNTGHRVLTLVLAYCIFEEEQVMKTITPHVDFESVERDMTMDGIMRDPIYLSPEEDSLYVFGGSQDVDIDFTDPQEKELWKDYVVMNEGWKWFADNKDQDKFGFITNSTGSHLAIEVSNWNKLGRIEVSYLMSYENFGTTVVWVDGFKENRNIVLCNMTWNHFTAYTGLEPIFAAWDELASVPSVQMLHFELAKIDKAKTPQVFLHFCLTPRNPERMKGTENKFKLLSVRLY